MWDHSVLLYTSGNCSWPTRHIEELRTTLLSTFQHSDSPAIHTKSEYLCSFAWYVEVLYFKLPDLNNGATWDTILECALSSCRYSLLPWSHSIHFRSTLRTHRPYNSSSFWQYMERLLLVSIPSYMMQSHYTVVYKVKRDTDIAKTMPWHCSGQIADTRYGTRNAV